jgi:two-component system, OmpR family, response regulator VicR
MKKVLVVEDDNIIVTVLNFLLKKEGFQVDRAVDGEQGMQRLSTGFYDLVITDVMLPYKTGIEIASFSKQKSPDTPVFIVSSLGNEHETLSVAEDIGVDVFIAKPFKPEVLVEKVKEVFNKNGTVL